MEIAPSVSLISEISIGAHELDVVIRARLAPTSRGKSEVEPNKGRDRNNDLEGWMGSLMACANLVVLA